MALIRSNFHLAFFKSLIKPFSSQFSTVVESTKNPNLSENDEETNETDANISTNITPQQNPVVEELHLLITDHYKRNRNEYKNPNCNFTIPSLAESFSQITSGECVSPSVVVSVIRKYRCFPHNIPFPQALAFFNWALGQGNSVEIFKQCIFETIDVAVKAAKFDVAWGLIDEMKSRKLEIPSDIFVRLIKRYGRVRSISEAIRISEAINAFNRMEEYGCSPDSAAVNAVITVLARHEKAVEAQSFFDGLKDWFEPDVVVYTNLIDGWCRVGNISEAERIIGEMKVKGIFPSLSTYTLVFDRFCKDGQIMQAHDVFLEMIEKCIQPNAGIFRNLMSGDAKVGKGKAKKILQDYNEMRRLGCRLINCHHRNGNRDVAGQTKKHEELAGKTEKILQVYNQIKRLGCQPDAIMYSHLINYHYRNGNRDDAMKLIDEMVNEGIVPSMHNFNQVIFSCIAKPSDVNAAQKLFAMMKELKCQPNAKTYRHLILMFCDMGDWSNGCKYFEEMIEEKNVTPCTHLYNMVLKQLEIAGQTKKREELMDMMVERGFANQPELELVSKPKSSEHP